MSIFFKFVIRQSHRKKDLDAILKIVKNFNIDKNKVVLMPNQKLYIWPDLVAGIEDKQHELPQVKTVDDLLRFPNYQPKGFPLDISPE